MSWRPGSSDGHTNKARLRSTSPNRANAARLKANELIRTRVKELLAGVAKKTVNALALDAVSILTRIQKRADAAAEAGDFKAALAGDIFIAKCFGYEDSPTLTHEHLNGKSVAPTRGPEPPHPNSVGNVVRFGRQHEYLKSLVSRNNIDE